MFFSWFGFGRLYAVGVAIPRPNGKSGPLTISELVSVAPSYNPNHDYFTTVDGFVAFNLSKSIVRTVNANALQPTDSLYFGSENPVVDAIFGSSNSTYLDPYISEVNLFNIPQTQKLFPDVISQWTVAPIFAQANPCLFSPPPTHITCILSNPVLGWAVATDSSSFCRLIGSSSCTLGDVLNQSLSIYYPTPLNFSTPITVGATGILASAPPDDITEAFRARYIADGWPFDVDTQDYPKGMPMVFLQINPDVPTEMDSLLYQSKIFSYIGIAVIGFTLSLVLIALYYDIKTDRIVLSLVAHQRTLLEEERELARKRDERKKRIAEIVQYEYNE
jgi:hypothetical protein